MDKKFFGKIFHKHIVVIAVALLSAFNAVAQESATIIDKIIDSYVPWTSAEFSGKLKAENLPLSPTVKMYMVRDSLLQISVRAPLVGEVGRLHFTGDELVIVNKLKKVYCEENPENLLQLYPSLLPDIQSLLLGRVVILGSGELDERNVGSVSVGDGGEGSWLLVPETGEGAIPFNYGYLVNPNARTRALVASIPRKVSLEILYDYSNRGEQLDVTLERSDGRQFGATLDFSTVKWGGSEMSPVKLGSYRRVTLKELVNSVK